MSSANVSDSNAHPSGGAPEGSGVNITFELLELLRRAADRAATHGAEPPALEVVGDVVRPDLELPVDRAPGDGQTTSVSAAWVLAHGVGLSSLAGAFLVPRSEPWDEVAVSVAFERVIMGYSNVVFEGGKEVAFDLREATVLHDVVAEELTRSRSPGVARYTLFAVTVKSRLRAMNRTDVDESEALPEELWPAWQRELLCKVRRLSPAGVLYVVDAVWRVMTNVRLGFSVDESLVDVGLVPRT